MKIRLAVPIDKISNKFYSEYDKAKFPDVELFKVKSGKVRDLLFNNRVEAALIDPLIYGQSTEKGDFRIIPKISLSSLAYTELLSVYFNKGLDTLNNIAVPSKSDYLILISLILIGERYGIIPEVFEHNDHVGILLKKFDSAIIYGKDRHFEGLDISEDWFDLYKKPLPINFWVCRGAEQPEKLSEIITNIAGKDTQNDVELGDRNDIEARYGRLSYKWTNEFQSGIEQALDLLYYHKLIEHIPDVKLLEQ